jgi:tRNA pseudouridine-54 N-methylase
MKLKSTRQSISSFFNRQSFLEKLMKKLLRKSLFHLKLKLGKKIAELACPIEQKFLIIFDEFNIRLEYESINGYLFLFDYS